MADTIISVFGMLFAAVAALGAWMTVRVTFQIQQEAKLRRVIEALISMDHAARDLDREPNVDARTKLEREDRLRAAQAELLRAGALPFVASVPFWESRDDGANELTGLLNLLTKPDVDIVQRPAEVSANANRAAVLLTSRPEPRSRSKWGQWWLKRWLWLKWHLFHVP